MTPAECIEVAVGTLDEAFSALCRLPLPRPATVTDALHMILDMIEALEETL